MAIKVLLLADDLTGACDAAVHFAMRGLGTAVAISPDGARGDAEVCAINLESRDLDAAEIAPLMARVAAAVQAPADTVILKKIDSTMRGRPGVETMEAMRAFACERAVFTPALPALGRVVEGGLLRVIDDADFAPIEVAVATGFPCPDAACDADLDRIVAEGLASGGRMMWAGSAGLAAALARRMGGGERAGTLDTGQARRPVLLIGSTHRVTVAQMEALRASGREHVFIAVPRGAKLVDPVPEGPLVLSGGDTASNVCRELGATWIELEGEIIPGVPHGILHGGIAEGRRVATKSGGFGAPDALIQVADFFQCRKN